MSWFWWTLNLIFMGGTKAVIWGKIFDKIFNWRLIISQREIENAGVNH